MSYESRIPKIRREIQRAIDDVLETSAEAIAAGARQRVPIESGDLLNAIHTDSQPEGVYVVAGNTDVFYGHIVEFGSARTGARPFLIPSLERNRGRLNEFAAAKFRNLR